MKLAYSLLLMGGWFIVGALYSPIAAWIHGSPPPPHPATPREEYAQRIDLPSKRDTRISRVLSALLENNRLKQRHALFLTIGDLTAADLGEMMARADELPEVFRSKAIQAVIDRWFELDPEPALAWVRTHPDELIYWTAWARHFPQDALKEAHANPSLPWASSMMLDAVIQMAGRDKKAMLATLAALPTDFLRDTMLMDLLRAWSGEDKAAALSVFKDAKVDPSLRRFLFTDEAWNNELEPQEFIRIILPELKEGRQANWIVADVAGKLATDGVDAAFQWASQLPAKFQKDAFARVASEWAKTDPAAALNWCGQNGIDTATVGYAFYSTLENKSVIGESMTKDPALTMDWISSLPPSPDRDAMLEEALTPHSQSAFATDATVELAIAWMSQLPPDAQRRVAYKLGNEIDKQTSPESMRIWTNRFPDGPVRAAAIEGAVRNHFRIFYTHKYTEAEVLNVFADTADHDAALSGIASAQVEATILDNRHAYFELAANNTLAINDPALRRDILDRFVPDWLHSEPGSARSWLAHTPAIPADWKGAWMVEANER